MVELCHFVSNKSSILDGEEIDLQLEPAAFYARVVQGAKPILDAYVE